MILKENKNLIPSPEFHGGSGRRPKMGVVSLGGAPGIFLSIVFFMICQHCIFAQEIKRKDNSADLFIQSGVTKLNSKDYKNAIDDFRNALRLSPDDTQAKKYLAISLNNYALLITKESDSDNAITCLEESVKLYEDEVARNNLSGLFLERAVNFYNRHEQSNALFFSRKALEVKKDNAEALKLMGNIFYNMEKLDEALSYYAKAVTLLPNDTEIRKSIDNIKKEKALKGSFRNIPSAKFIIRYENKSADFDYYQFRPILDEAYRVIGQDLGLFPSEQLVVILYTQESYKNLKEQPSSVTGLFDGKIHIPLRDGVKDTSEYKTVVYHEYTHALIFDLTLGRCPIWLNEGLAEYEESKIKPVELRRLKAALKNNSLIGISSLDQTFSLMNGRRQLTQEEQELIALAYEESYTIAKYILHRFTRAHIQQLLRRLREGASINEALKRELYLSVEQLQKQWIEFIQNNYR
jgi:tetratricopeptide (TPR) repeat protein